MSRKKSKYKVTIEVEDQTIASSCSKDKEFSSS